MLCAQQIARYVVFAVILGHALRKTVLWADAGFWGVIDNLRKLMETEMYYFTLSLVGWPGRTFLWATWTELSALAASSFRLLSERQTGERRLPASVDAGTVAIVDASNEQSADIPVADDWLSYEPLGYYEFAIDDEYQCALCFNTGFCRFESFWRCSYCGGYQFVRQEPEPDDTDEDEM